MKKIILTGILNLIILQAFAQLNPIQNLNWEHWYVEHNYFKLTWGVPELSEDTLVGYNIYRNNDFYRFQSDTILNHEELGIGNCTNEFLDYNCNGDFWIHVTAVYNSIKIESAYNDSVYVTGTIISVPEEKQREFNLFPNPTTGKLLLDALKIDKIIIVNGGGRIVQIIEEKNQLDLSHLPKGIYFLRIYSGENINTKKVILD